MPRGTKRSAVSVGYISGLQLEGDTLTYCDSRGGRALDLSSGVESARERPCDRHEERNRACAEIDFIDAVREPDQNDIIDLNDGMSIPVNGHIHDCAFSSGTLLVATGLEVVAIDVKADQREVLSKEGGQQVAINGSWLAWSEALDKAEKVLARRR